MDHRSVDSGNKLSVGSYLYRLGTLKASGYWKQHYQGCAMPFVLSSTNNSQPLIDPVSLVSAVVTRSTRRFALHATLSTALPGAT